MSESPAELDAPRRPDRPHSARDDVLHRLLKNAAHLLSGRIVAAGLAVGTVAVMARALGPELLGVLVMIEAYARVVDRLVRLETWQALVTYGAAALERSDSVRLLRLLKFGAALDLSGAALAAVVAVAAAPLTGKWLGWSPETVWMAQIYSLSAMANFASAPIGALRLFDRFPAIAWLEAATTALRLLAALTAYLAGAGLWAFVMLSMGVLIASQLVLVLLALQEIARRGCGRFLLVPLRGVTFENPRIWEFIWSSNATVLVRRITQEFDNLLVGSMLGPAAVGIYHLSKRLGNAMIKAGGLLQQAIFPDLARLWVRGDRRAFLKVVTQVSLGTAAIMGAALLVVGLNAERLLVYVVGARFKEAALPLVVQLAAVALLLSGSGLRPALTTMGLQMSQLKITLVSAAAFYVCMLLAVPQLGVLGANLAHVVFNGIWLPAMVALFITSMRRADFPAGGR
jgi:O-antigen/teichoic acid export membrane protein